MYIRVCRFVYDVIYGNLKTKHAVRLYLSSVCLLMSWLFFYKNLSTNCPQLHEVTTAYEQEKFDLQKQHTKTIQELLDDTNQRLQKMEDEYGSQMQATVSNRLFDSSF